MNHPLLSKPKQLTIIPPDALEPPLIDIDLPDKIDVESLLKDFTISNEENFNVYLQQLSKDFHSQSDNPGLGINKMTFLNYFQLPGIIGERLYAVFSTNHSDYLDDDEFITGMTRLYTGDFESLCKFIFDFYDFDEDQIISKEDVRTVLSYIPLRREKQSSIEQRSPKEKTAKYVHKREFKNIVESQEELNNLIEKCFYDEINNANVSFMNYSKFKYVVQNVSSEIFLYILVYLLKKRPFSKDTLNLYENIILKGILTPKVTMKISMGNNTSKILIPSPSTKSKFSPSLAIKHSPYMKEKAKTTLLKAKELKTHKNAKKILNQFALNSHSSNNNNSSGSSNDNKTKTIEIKKKGELVTASSSSVMDRPKNIGASTNLRPKTFSLSNTQGDKFNDLEALVKLSKMRVKVNSSKHANEPEHIDNNSNNNNNSSNNNDDEFDGNIKAVQMKRKYRCFLKDLKDDLVPLNVSKTKPTTTNTVNNNQSSVVPTPTTPLSEDTNLSSAFKYNFTNIFHDQIIDEEEEELKEGQEEVQYEGYLYKISRMKTVKRRYLKLIQKDLYTYEHQNDSNHKALHNLSGVFIETCKPSVYEGKTYYTFRLIFSKKNRYYYCESENEYNNWLEKLRIVTGSFNLNDSYKISNKLGKGKFATVRLGTKITTGEEVAIKIINKEAMDEKELEQARTEIEIMKISKHPYIVKLFDVFENRMHIYIIMELCKGGDLFSYLEKRSFKINEYRAAELTKHIMTALYYLHSFGIVHRDIKPENIMMTNDTETSDIRLIDFGLSKLLGPNEKCEESFGTLGYVAPEVLMEQPYDKSVDYWSIGIVAYLLITGCLPFDDEDPKEIIRQTLYDNVPYPKYLWKVQTPEAKKFVGKLLQKTPDKRMKIKEALEHPWFKLHNKIQLQKVNNTLLTPISDFQKYTHVINDSDISEEINILNNGGNLYKMKTEMMKHNNDSSSNNSNNNNKL